MLIKLHWRYGVLPIIFTSIKKEQISYVDSGHQTPWNLASELETILQKWKKYFVKTTAITVYLKYVLIR